MALLNIISETHILHTMHMHVSEQLYLWIEKVFSEEVAAYSIVLWNLTKCCFVHYEEMAFLEL